MNSTSASGGANPLGLPLSGFRVIDLTTVLFGPYAAQLLGDLGADVIKVEAPEGDVTRNLGPARSRGMGAGFLGVNRNKRSVVLDLKREAAKAALWRLIDTADVFMHNIRPQKIAALGFTPDAVIERKSDIVYGSFHGYLEEGPYAGRPAYDDVIQSESGIAATFAARDGEPALAPFVAADKSAGLLATTGLTAALIQKLRTQRAVYMEIGMFESMVGYTLLEHQYGTIFEPADGVAGYPRAISPQRKPHKTRDGYICLLAYTDKQWASFWHIAERPEMLDDPRYADIATRTRNIDALYASAGAVLADHPTQWWLDQLRAAEVPCGPVNTFDDLYRDEHLNAIDFFRATEHPTEGSLRLMDTGLRFNREALPVRQLPPAMGEHSEAVLREAGLSSDEIRAALGREDG